MKKRYTYIAVLIVSVIFTFYFTSNYFHDDYIKIEKNQNHKNIVNLLGQLEKTFLSINSILVDYANWDQTYKFIENRNQEYIYDNFRDSSGTLEDLNINFMIFTTLNDKMVFSKHFNTTQNKKSLDSLAIEKFRSKKSKKGFILYKERLFFVAKTGITNSDATKDINGFMYIGKVLDSNYLKNLDVNFEKIQIVDKSESLDIAVDYSLYTKKINADLKKIIDLEKNSIINYIDILNSDKNKLIRIEAIGKMNFYKQSRTTVLVFSLLISLLVSIIVILLFRQNERLSKKVYEKTLKLQESEALLIEQSRMAAMGEMIANIAHQLKQPLSIISTISSSVVFEKKMNMYDDSKTYKYMEEILNSANHLSDTIDDFRDFFKPKKEIVYINSNSIVEKSLSLTQAQFHNRNIKVIKDLKDCELKLYDNQLLHVFLNILNNAKDELLKVEDQEKRLLFISNKVSVNSISFYIYDSAGGIKEEILDNVFKPYFTTKEKENGTGIGLYMSKKIVEDRLSGVLLVSNKSFDYEGSSYKGACFKIKIPKSL